jgi:hypothetical protein
LTAPLAELNPRQSKRKSDVSGNKAVFSAPTAIHGMIKGIFWVDFNGCFGTARKVLPFWRNVAGNLYFRGRRRVVAAACLTGSCFQLESAALIAHIAQSLLLTAQGLPLMCCRLLAGLIET